MDGGEEDGEEEEEERVWGGEHGVGDSFILENKEMGIGVFGRDV